MLGMLFWGHSVESKQTGSLVEFSSILSRCIYGLSKHNRSPQIN